MAAPTIELTTDDAFAETVGDAALTALLQTKPREDEIPSAVWWLIAETLRTSVEIRRALAAPVTAERGDLQMLLTEARLLTDAALAELAETTGARPTPIAVPRFGTPPAVKDATRPAFGLQLSVLFLARMLVTHKTTSPQRLANTLSAHLRALTAATPAT
jgi:hypothetical protein